MIGWLSVWSWINTQTQAFFYRFVACAFPCFEIISILPIDRYQNAMPRATRVQLQEHFTLIKHDSYWSSENAVHEHFIASSGVWVWMKTRQLIAGQSDKKMCVFEYEFSLMLISFCCQPIVSIHTVAIFGINPNLPAPWISFLLERWHIHLLTSISWA